MGADLGFVFSFPFLNVYSFNLCMTQTQKVSCELWDRRALEFQASKMDI